MERLQIVGGHRTESEMSEMAELPNWSVGDNGVAGPERTEMSEVMNVGINEWMGCTDIETIRLSGSYA